MTWLLAAGPEEESCRHRKASGPVTGNGSCPAVDTQYLGFGTGKENTGFFRLITKLSHGPSNFGPPPAPSGGEKRQ